ncbi:hypothetical protein NDA16_005066 [Ustilago loliicola]|nr:hypothetical protein NDA16_005066 [Ustilago loliicola]
MSSRQGQVKPRASGRASIPTPPVKFPLDDKPGQLSTRKQQRYPGQKPKQARGFSGWLISFGTRVTIFYLIFAALWTCPSRPFAFDYSAKDARPVCRNLAQAHDQLAPIVTPYLRFAQQKAEPYTRPVIQAATSWVKRANKVVRPIYREADKRGRLIWKKRIDPARRRALKRARKQIDPYVQQAQSYHKRKVQPHFDTVHKAVKPYHDIYQRDVSPYVDRAYQYSLQSSSVSYAFYMNKVHPRVVHSIKQVYSFLANHVDPAVRRFYSLYVRPQLERLIAKVYERKAHYLGSDAIKTAQSEMKQAAKEADRHTKESVKKAEQDAIKAQNDPSLLDRVKQAKDAVVDSATGKETDPVKVAQLDAELDAEEEKVKDLLEVWENGMTDLIEKEYKLAVDRVADLRNKRLADLPDRFGLINEAFVEDTVALILNRVERGLRKLAVKPSDSNAEAKKKLAAGDKLVDQQIAKFDEAAQDTKAQISAFYEELLQQERQAIETSSAEVRRYAAAAKEAYDDIMRDAKFSVTMDEWHGWDLGVRKRASMFAEELAAVQSNKKAVSTASGAVDLRKEAPDMQKEINSLRNWTDKLHSAARKELIVYCDTALAQLGGEGVAAKISDVTDRLAEQASRISTDAAAGMLGAVGAARSKLGLGEPASEGYVARAKSYIASGTGSGSSFDDYLNSLNANVGAVGSSVSSVAAQASSSIASAVVTSSTPAVARASAAVAGAASNVAANVQAAAGKATDAAASAASSASSAASKASRSAASAVGASPTPETFEDYVDAFTAGVEAAVDTAVAQAGSVSASASSLASKASRSVASAVGASPTPETVEDYTEVVKDNVDAAAGKVGGMAQAAASSASSLASVASKSASGAAGAGASSVSSAASVVYASAGSAAQSGASSASSLGSVVYASANSAAKSGASSASSAASAASKSIGSAAAPGASSASSLASAASRSAASAVGASPSPETFADRVEDLQNQASGAASVIYASASSLASVGSKSAVSVAGTPASVASSASSVVSKASRSVASAVGASPTPETVGDYVEDAKDAAQSIASKVASVAHVEL